ncbi:protein MCM10 homolog [Toxorhynchites rutilus septentrionalis]|uniref:protein MCM10 homolog n=1 Tax=Toxorhynchites rutilus septentrionalis TaxID=329112 RepID=UPI00247AA4A4|nr:protein MCM10 homolog [Toxorhynchites rutilus septentrionalis]XP_055638694.1 protein MCM10 homolog [Toxorhynchites rutilus septentrionalis]
MSENGNNRPESSEMDDLEQLLLEAESEDMINNVSSVKAKEDPSKKVKAKPSLTLSGSTFLEEFVRKPNAKNVENSVKSGSAVHGGDTDSSDDEETRNFLEQKYNEYGKSINTLLKQKEEEKIDNRISNMIDQALRNEKKDASERPAQSAAIAESTPKQQFNPFPGTVKGDPLPPSKNDIPDIFKKSVYTDPVFGIRIVHPLVSSAVLQERMEGKKAVSMARIKYHIEHEQLKNDWAIAGVVLNKSPPKTTSKGGQFSIWRLSDLHGEIKVVSLFLFSQAYKDLWKTAEGMVICILNPNVFERNDDRNSEATLSIDKSAKVMILGQSRDMGTCRSKKKNGEKCTAFVNLEKCEYCVYHVKQEYSKACNRGGLISSTAGRGLNELRNKVLGKNEVFYGGQSFTAVKAKKNPKQVEKDNHRMMTLSEYYQSPLQGTNSAAVPSYRQQQSKAHKPSAAGLEMNMKQREKDLERLKQLGSTSSVPSVTPQKDISKEVPKSEQKPTPPSSAPNEFENRSFSFQAKQTPRLSTGNFVIDFAATPKQAIYSRQKAMEILKKKPLEKSNPNFIKYRGTDVGKKRAIEEIISNEDSNENVSKKQKLEQEEQTRKERLKKILEATSSHTDLIKAHEDEQQEKYFKELERKEAMEEKMLNTYQVACKAVICKQCKYIAFSAANRCKVERHELTVRDAEKRFFKCADCGNRTISLHRLPKTTCKNCQSSRWERCAMMREKRGPLLGASLSIRGDEEKHLGSCANTANLNLLVPECD